MANIERMTIALPSEMASKVREAVNSGDYASSSEVFRDAMRQWLRRRILEARELDAVKQALQDGLADIEAGNIKPADDVFDRLERKYKA